MLGEDAELDLYCMRCEGLVVRTGEEERHTDDNHSL